MSTVLARPTPYKGLVPYAEEDAPFFFGRERDREIISANLLASTLTILYGPSGVGKSSVLRAGVAAHLQEVARERAGQGELPEYVIVVFSSWQDDPVPALLEAVRDSVLSQAGIDLDMPDPSIDLAAALSTWTASLGVDFLIILDQFEEYFVYHGAQAASARFAVEFASAANQRVARTNWLIGIREDAVAKLDVFKGQIPHLFQNYLRIDHLDRAGARAAIVEPIERYNALTAPELPFQLGPGLVDAVLDQLQAGRVKISAGGEGRTVAQLSGPGQIEAPYLQLVMTRLWNEETGQGSRELQLGTLSAMGGADRIVRTHLDDAIRTLPLPAQDTAARVFRFLVTPSGSKIAHSARDLADYAEAEANAVEGALQRLAAADLRIIRPISPGIEQDGAVRYEIYHDVLAPAILDWQTRHTKQAEVAAAERRAREELSIESVRGLGSHLSQQVFIGSVILALLVVMDLAASPDDSILHVPSWLIAALAWANLMLFVWMGQTLRRIWRGLQNATSLGFHPLFTLLLMTEPVNKPISGVARLFAARTDRDLITPRIVGKLSIILAAALPIITAVLVLRLASRGVIGQPSLVWELVFAPFVILLVASIVISTVLWLRARGRPQAGSADLDDAAEAVLRPRASATVPPIPRFVKPSLILGWLLLVICAFATVHLATIPFVAGIAWQVATPANLNRQTKSQVATFGAAYRLRPFSNVTPALAGQIRHELERIDSTVVPLRNERPLRRQLPYAAVAHSVTNRFYSATDTLIVHALGGLSSEDRAALSASASHPAVALLADFAHAQTVDYWGAAFEPGFMQQFASSYELPIRIAGLRYAANATLQKAAIAAADRRFPEAEQALRTMISAGVVLSENAGNALESALGLSFQKQGLKSLADLYDLTDRHDAAVPIRSALDQISQPVDENYAALLSARESSLDGQAVRREILAILADSSTARGYRWELVVMLGSLPCTNMRELIFGPTSVAQKATASARQQLVRFESEREVFEFLIEPPTRISGVVQPGILYRLLFAITRANAWILGNERVTRCTVPLLYQNSVI